MLPVAGDLPCLARPFTPEELERARALVRRWGLEHIERSAAIEVSGTGPDLNLAADNGLERAAPIMVPAVKQFLW